MDIYRGMALNYFHPKGHGHGQNDQKSVVFEVDNFYKDFLCCNCVDISLNINLAKKAPKV